MFNLSTRYRVQGAGFDDPISAGLFKASNPQKPCKGSVRLGFFGTSPSPQTLNPKPTLQTLSPKRCLLLHVQKQPLHLEDNEVPARHRSWRPRNALGFRGLRLRIEGRGLRGFLP